MSKPNEYFLGGKPKIKLTTIDEDGVGFIPTLSRLSIKEPDGDIVTISGGDMTYVGSGLSYYLYHPDTTGWYEYEGWVRDGHGFEDTDSNGFEIIDRVY